MNYQPEWKSLKQEINKSLEIIDRNISTANLPVVWASGGKDSTALLHLLRHWREKVVILHLSLGDEGWPDITETLQENLEVFGYQNRLIVLNPSIKLDQYIQVFGWPVSVIPTKYEGATAISDSPYRDQPVRFSSWWHCRYSRILLPLAQATLDLKADLIIMGSKQNDGTSPAYATEFDVSKETGWKRINPLADWQTKDIYQYINEYKIKLPNIYAKWKTAIGKSIETVDCMRCTYQPKMWTDVLPKHYPDVYKKNWSEVKKVYKIYYNELKKETSQLEDILKDG